MSEYDVILVRRRQLKRQYAGLYQDVARILCRHDPLCVSLELSTSGYDEEVDAILPRLSGAASAADVETILHDVCSRCMAPGQAGAAHLPEIAAEIWEAYQRHRSPP
jgi:hypothetical protein